MRTVIYLLLLPSLFTLQYILAQRVIQYDSAVIELPAQRDYKWSPEIFRLLSMGHLPAAVDLLMIRAMTEDPGFSHVAPGSHPPAYYDIDLATDLDPAFMEIYRGGASLLAVIRNDTPGALLLLEKAERYRQEVLPTMDEKFRSRFWGNQWEIPALLAYIHLFEFPDIVKAKEDLKKVASLPEAHSFWKALALRLESPGGEMEVAERVLGVMIHTASDVTVREKIEDQLKKIRLLRDLDRMTEEFRLFAKAPESPHDPISAWKLYKRKRSIPDTDPLGGVISYDPNKNRVLTTTSMEAVRHFLTTST